jgi:signal peptide peptidase SppA
MKRPNISLAPLFNLMSQVPVMRGDAFAAWQREWAPLMLGEADSLAAFAQRKFADMGDDPEDDDPDESPPWEIDADDMIDVEGSVAIVGINGKLCTGLSDFEAWIYNMVRTEDISMSLEAVARIPGVSSAILNINSPGGFSMGMPELAGQIAELSRTMPTCAFTNGQMCSAAYWIGSQCTGVYSTISAQVGCVGTYAVYYDYSEMLKERGVSVDVIKAGDFKGIGVFGTSLTKEQRAFMQADIDKTNARFLSSVKSARSGVEDADLQGQWFDGEDAQAKHLTDGVVASLGQLVSTFNVALSPYAAMRR